MPSGWRLVNKSEARINKERIKPLLEQWTIAKLSGGWKIMGSGYGYKIKLIDPNRDRISQQVIVRKGYPGNILRLLFLHYLCLHLQRNPRLIRGSSNQPFIFHLKIHYLSLNIKNIKLHIVTDIKVSL